MLLVLYEVKT